MYRNFPAHWNHRKSLLIVGESGVMKEFTVEFYNGRFRSETEKDLNILLIACPT